MLCTMFVQICLLKEEMSWWLSEKCLAHSTYHIPIDLLSTCKILGTAFYIVQLSVHPEKKPRWSHGPVASAPVFKGAHFIPARTGPAPVITASNLSSRRYHENRRPPFQQA
jgi:hypothetical protein